MTFGIRERTIFGMDFRRSFSAPRVPVFAVLACSGILLVVQRGGFPPLVAVWIVTLSALDVQFNNLFYRSASELEALTLLPVSWRGVVTAKNFATLGAAVVLGGAMSMVILYFSPRQPDAVQFGAGMLYAWTLVFPLLIIGNLRSVQEPKKGALRTADALIQSSGMFLLVVACSLPYVILYTVADSAAATIVYGGVAVYFWYRRSIPRTAARAEQLMTS